MQSSLQAKQVVPDSVKSSVSLSEVNVVLTISSPRREIYEFV